MSKKTIQNWTVFGATTVGITLFKHDVTGDESGEFDHDFWYQVSLDIVLDDDTEIKTEDDIQHISICTDIGADTAQEALEMAAHSVINMFDMVQDDILVIDDNGEVVEILSLTDIVEDLVGDEYMSKLENPSGILH